MTEAARKIKVMRAFDVGIEIESIAYDMSGVAWEAAKNPTWDWHRNNYRVKVNWYDDIPKHGVLCWVSDGCAFSQKHIAIIHAVHKNKKREINYEESRGATWVLAEPLTNKEIKPFLRGSEGAVDALEIIKQAMIKDNPPRQVVMLTAGTAILQ